jgi:hypothetical protein
MFWRKSRNQVLGLSSQLRSQTTQRLVPLRKISPVSSESRLSNQANELRAKFLLVEQRVERSHALNAQKNQLTDAPLFLTTPAVREFHDFTPRRSGLLRRIRKSRRQLSVRDYVYGMLVDGLTVCDGERRSQLFQPRCESVLRACPVAVNECVAQIMKTLKRAAVEAARGVEGNPRFSDQDALERWMKR